MKHSIFTIVLMLFIILGFVIDNKESVNIQYYSAQKADPLPCCNSLDPRYNNYANFSWFCYENGIEIEKTVTWQQCYCAWQINNWNPPIGLKCDILETSECSPEEVKSNIKK